jgi:RNA polymerase sigma-70 factor (ECF subfamily)
MLFPNPTDLVERARSGEKAPLDELIKTIAPYVEHQLLRYPVSTEDRRDLLQMTLLRVVKRIGSFRGDSSFSTWLFRVTANEALMLMRAHRRRKARLVEGMELDDLAAAPAPVADESREPVARERDAVVREAIAALPDDYRKIVVAHYRDERGLQQIADEMRVTESAVRSRLHRARSRLRALLGSSEIAVGPGLTSAWA